MNKLRKTTITIEDIDLDIEFYYYKGRPAKLYGPYNESWPTEEPEIDIDKVSVSGTDIDIGCILSVDVFDLIETKILENINVDD
jgi:hypothetical protein